MSTINQIKQLAEADTPLLFFQCVLPSGDTQYWSTYSIPFAGNDYVARVLKHNLFELQLCADDAMDGVTKLTLTLANADSELSQLNTAIGFKGSQLTVYFAFVDLPSLAVTSETAVLFQGIAGDPDQIGEYFLTLNFSNRLSLQRVPRSRRPRSAVLPLDLSCVSRTAPRSLERRVAWAILSLLSVWLFSRYSRRFWQPEQWFSLYLL